MRPWTDDKFGSRQGMQDALQWGHGLAAVDGGRAIADLNADSELQWGHGLAAVDGLPALGLLPLGQLLQWGHGLAAVDGGLAGHGADL